MTAARMTVDHIALTLVGVPQADAAVAAHSLDRALRDRLGGWRPEIAGGAPLDLGDIDLGTIELARIDAPTLASIVVQHVSDRVTHAAAQRGSAL
jgi:hypothetical protein